MLKKLLGPVEVAMSFGIACNSAVALHTSTIRRRSTHIMTCETVSPHEVNMGNDSEEELDQQLVVEPGT